jgi:hypothetical protein
MNELNGYLLLVITNNYNNVAIFRNPQITTALSQSFHFALSPPPRCLLTTFFMNVIAYVW